MMVADTQRIFLSHRPRTTWTRCHSFLRRVPQKVSNEFYGFLQTATKFLCLNDVLEVEDCGGEIIFLRWERFPVGTHSIELNWANHLSEAASN